MQYTNDIVCHPINRRERQLDNCRGKCGWNVVVILIKLYFPRQWADLSITRYFRSVICKVSLTILTNRTCILIAKSSGYWHCPHSMGSKVYETLRCPSVCPFVPLSVCPSMGPQQQTRCCRFAAVDSAGRRYRSTAVAAAGECGQCHVVSVRR